MLTLYYSSGACSLSPHIALHEADVPHKLVRVDLKNHVTEDGEDYYTINPMGAVPFLKLEDGRTLSEGPAIVQYIADQAPESGLAPANGSFERYQLQQWLNFITSELHKSFGPIFKGGSASEQQAAKEKIAKALQRVEQHLADGRAYLLGETFSVADGYLYTVMRWALAKGVPMEGLDKVKAHHARVEARPAVQAAHAMEKNHS